MTLRSVFSSILAAALGLACCLLVLAPTHAQAQGLISQERGVPLVAPEVQAALELINLGELDKAETAIVKGLEASPLNPNWSFLQGLLLAERGQNEAAIRSFEAISQRFPEFAETYNNLAVLYARQGQTQLALEALQRAVQNRPDYPIAQENLGDFYVQLALASYRKAASLAGSSPFAPLKRDHLLQLPRPMSVSSAAAPLPSPYFVRVSSKQPKGKKVSQVELHTNKGLIVLELDTEKAPKTVANFVQYVNDGHYNGTIFHRVINGFMVQGGGFDTKMAQKPTRDPITNEADNGLKNDAYTVAMARTNDPHSASAQFFINVSNNDFLNFRAPTGSGWGYAVFGKVVEGKDVVDAIKAVPTGNSGFHQDVPKEPVEIQKAVVR